MTSHGKSDDGFAEIRPCVGQLVAKAGLGTEFRAQRVEGGRNNRVFHMTCGPADFALKWYYQDKVSDRNRLGAEYSFCELCWSHGIETVPQPLKPRASECVQ